MTNELREILSLPKEVWEMAVRTRVAALVSVVLVLAGGCAPTPPRVEPECLQGVTTPLIDLPNLVQLGSVTLKNSTTEVSTSGGIDAHSITSEPNHWAVRLPPPNESVMLLIEPGGQAKKTGFPYSILSNDGDEDLYLQKERCTSLLKIGDAFAYIGNVTFTVYIKSA